MSHLFKNYRLHIAYSSIRAVQNKHRYLFGPTYLQLIVDDLKLVKSFTRLKRPRQAKGKGAVPTMDAGGVEFGLEKDWILAHVVELQAKKDAEVAKKLADEAEWAAGGGVECGCCFDDFLPVSIRHRVHGPNLIPSASSQLIPRATWSGVKTDICSAKNAAPVIPRPSSAMRFT